MGKIKNDESNVKDLIIKQVDFFGDSLLSAQERKSNKIYISIKSMCDSLGLTRGQVNNERLKIQEDLVLKQGSRNFILPTNGGFQDIVCLELDFVPLWMAKISITNQMKEKNPDIVNKLIKYQLECKDVLAKHFLIKDKEWNLTREVTKMDRKRMTSSIKVNVENINEFTYSNYTDMIYKILFGKKAKELRLEKNVKTNDLLRDSFNEEELKKVDLAESIVTGLLHIGYGYDEIKQRLVQKFSKNKLIK